MGFLYKIFNWYFNKQSLPFWCIFLMDCAIVFASYLFVYQQFNSGAQTLNVIELLTLNILAYLIFYAIGFKLFRTYSGILRYSSFIDLKKVGYAMALGMVLSYGANFLLKSEMPFGYINNIEIVASSILGTLLLWLTRILAKNLYDISLASINAQYAYIYGVQDGGIGIAKQIADEKPLRFQLKGFVTDEKMVQNKILRGVHVHKIDDQLIDRMIDEGVEALIVSPLRAQAFRNNQALQDALINAGIHIYISETEKEWDGHSDLPISQLKEIDIEDLLPRAEIQVDMNLIAHQFAGSTILITGSAGSIGSEIVRQICALKPKQLVLIDQAETPQHDIRLMMKNKFPFIPCDTVVASICNEKHMEALFRKYHPDFVFHAAAYKHVPMMEDNPSESVYNNVYGTKVMADLAVKYFAKRFVMISTDKAVNPTNVMGCSKRICEMYVQSLDKAIKDGTTLGITQFVTTRFGNVLGSNGSVIPLFKEQIRQGGPVTVTDPDIIRYFMLISEACKLVLEAGSRGKGGEIFVFDMGNPVKISDLAKRMIKLSGAQGVEIKYTGLRPGEKLYEEVLNKEETTKPSFHQKIRIANVTPFDYSDIRRQTDSLMAISQRFDDMQTVKKMKEMVPEYKSNNSVYDQLDK